ncbi:hypothetical protein PspLS_09348 [Pyricularia sp. CBS 133598]|nr:hypothetical protein PspLS_09348 [Pyricularia sp. CBS 133598]
MYHDMLAQSTVARTIFSSPQWTPLPGKRIGKLRDGLGAVAAGRQGKIGRASSLITSWLYAVRIRS